jgi:hypothetical protein
LDPRKLLISAFGLIALWLGWSALDATMPASAAVTPELFEPAGPATVGRGGPDELWDRTTGLSRRMAQPARLLIGPLFALLDPASRWGVMLHALLAVVWLLAVWGICGGAIARIAVIQVAKLRQPGLGEALGFALKSAGPLMIAPLCPLLGIAFCAAMAMVFGLLYRLMVVGPALAGILLFLPLAGGLVMTLLVAGQVAGWPLMQAALATGATGALDALSRTFSYLNQRLGTFAAALALAWLAGIVGLLFVDLFAEGLIQLTHWSLSFSAPGALLAAMFSQSDPPGGTVAAAAHRFWLGAVRLLAQGWIFSFFWSASAVLYLWLRHEVDGTPWSEIDPPGAHEAGASSPVPAPADASAPVSTPTASG